MTQPKRIMVDMSVTLLHHGHIRILKAASEMGRVIVALTTDEEIAKSKGFKPELSYSQRKEILEAIQYVDEVVPSAWLIDEGFLDEHAIDLLVHGDDNSNPIPEERLLVLPRTTGVSSDMIRKTIREAQ